LAIGKGSDLMNLHAVTLTKVSDQMTA
jgi:hypothetical protein